MNFSIKDFFSKCDQICRKLRIWSHLLKKSLMANFIFYAVFHVIVILARASSCTAWKVSVSGVILVRIFLHSDWIRKGTEYLSLLSPNAGKCGPEYLRMRTLFTQCNTLINKHGVNASKKNIAKTDFAAAKIRTKKMVIYAVWKLRLIK